MKSVVITAALRENAPVYFTDRGIEELEQRRVERLATWLARLDDDE